MNKNLSELIDEAIKLEMNVARIYLNFHFIFREDADFWMKLYNEEKNHAALLEKGKQNFLDAGRFPVELVGSSVESFVEANRKLKGVLKEESPPSRVAAFNLALNMETLAGEMHYQNAMQQVENPSDIVKLFRALNKDDKDHASRIRNYMREHGIEITHD